MLEAASIVLCMGCRERTRGAISIRARARRIHRGRAPSGIWNMVGRRVVILGSGDIGLILARRMTLGGREGAGLR